MSFPLASRDSFMFCVSRVSSGPIWPEISPVRITWIQCDSKIFGYSVIAAFSDEPDNAARIRKAYQLLFGRTPDEGELKAGLEFLKAEPLQSYEERKTEKENKKDAKTAEKEPEPESKPDEVKADGMMGGVTRAPGQKADEKLLPVTPWGRYAKVLLSSAEFLFVN